MTKVSIIQNLLTKQHLNGRYHFPSMIWVDANLCVPESSKCIWNSNKTLLKTSDSKGGTYGLNHMSAWSKLHPISGVPIVMINLSHLRWPPALWYPIRFFARLCISSWNHIDDYHTVLNQYNLTWSWLTPLHYTDVLYWIVIFQLLVNENYFSVPFEHHT